LGSGVRVAAGAARSWGRGDGVVGQVAPRCFVGCAAVPSSLLAGAGWAALARIPLARSPQVSLFVPDVSMDRYVP